MLAFNSTSMWHLFFITEQYFTTLFVHYIVDSTLWLHSIVFFYFGAYFTEQYVLYFTLAFSITFYVGAYFTEQYFTRFYTYFLLISTIHIFKQYVVLYFTLAFSITFFVGAYFTEKYFSCF